MSAIQPRCPTLGDGVNRPNRAHLGCLAQHSDDGAIRGRTHRRTGARHRPAHKPERAELLRAICPFARGLKKLGRSDELKDSPAADVRPIPPTRTSAIGGGRAKTPDRKEPLEFHSSRLGPTGSDHGRNSWLYLIYSFQIA